MNKTSSKLIKTDLFFLVSIITVFILLRVPSLIEPLWYGDEAIYQVIGDALNSGRSIYSEIWDNKPPLLYYVYAFANSDIFTVKLLTLIFGAVSIVPFYLLSKKIFNNNTAYLTTIIFSILFAVPLLEGNIANAENFMLLPVITASLLIYILTIDGKVKSKTKSLYLITAGLLLGVSFLFKIVAVFDLIAFILFMIISIFNYKESNQKIKKIIKYTALIKSGFIVPLILISFYYILNGNFYAFIQSAFFENIGYVEYANTFLIPQGLLILKFLLLIVSLIIIIRYSKSLPSSVLFIFLWFIFALWNALFSGRVWTHYLLTVLPAFALLTGLMLSRSKPVRIASCFGILVLIYFSNSHFKINDKSILNSVQYYFNFITYTSGASSINDYRSFFDSDVPRDYAIAKYLKTNTSQNDNIFIWGNNPQIYHLTDKLPPGRYTVAYHIIQNPGAINETRKVLQKTHPKYIIMLESEPEYPFSLNNYRYVYNIKGAHIYEKFD